MIKLYSCNDDDCSAQVYRNGLCRYHFSLERKLKEIVRKEHFNKITPLPPKHRKKEKYIQYMLFHKVQLLGLDMIPEYSEKGNRYDAVICENGIPIAIIEVKRAGYGISAEQRARYTQNSFKVPVLALIGEAKLDFVITQLKALMKKPF